MRATPDAEMIELARRARRALFADSLRSSPAPDAERKAIAGAMAKGVETRVLEMALRISERGDFASFNIAKVIDCAARMPATSQLHMLNNVRTWLSCRRTTG